MAAAWQAFAIIFLVIKAASVACSAVFAVKCQAAHRVANAAANAPRARVDAMEMGAVPATSVTVVGDKM